jgi:excisionase family DNA binding protein
VRSNGHNAGLLQDQSGGKELMTVEDVAGFLKVPRSWVYERTRRRGLERLPHIKLGKYLRFEEAALREFLERQRAR